MNQTSRRPPEARRDSAYTRVRHGVSRSDPYHWMRDTESDETLDNLRAEREYYDASVLDSTSLAADLRSAIVARIPERELGAPVDHAQFCYYTHRPPGREHGEIRRFPRTTEPTPRTPSPDTDELVLDMEQLAADSSYVELGLRELSPDESLLAYSVDLTGDEVYELAFRDLSSGNDLPDRVPRSYYTGAWSSRGDSFFYTVHDEAYRPFQVRRHVLGTDVSSDEIVFDEPDEQFDVEVRACRSGGLIVITSASRDTTEQWLIDPRDPAAPPRMVEPRSKGREYAVEHAPYDEQDRLVVLTNDEATEFRLATTSTASPGREHWRSLVPENQDERLSDVEAFAGFLVVTLRSGGLPRVRLIRHDGTVIRELQPPPAGHVELTDNPRWDATSVTVSRQSYVDPPVWTDVAVESGQESSRHRADIPGYDHSRYISTRIAVPARDGEQIPVTLVRRADVELDGTAPCLMYGYGAYEAVFESEFDAALTALLDRGVVYAHAHVRGGGEGGRRWWLDGRLEAKQHTFSDHIDVGDALAKGYVDGSRIVTRGLSAGGLLQGAVFSQRTDRWRAVVAEVPFVDVVTTMLDPTIPLTPGEWDEWGDPRREADFRWMLAYSPYDAIPPAGNRPDLLVTAALHDARVMVWEPAKWVAALRASDPDWSPRCLFRVDTGAGAHTGPSGRFARAAYEAEILSFVVSQVSD